MEPYLMFDDALYQLISECRPSPEALRLLNTQANLWADRLGVRLSERLQVLRPMGYGSTSRGTSTQPINDCDRILFLQIPTRSDGVPDITPRALLTALGCVAADGLISLRSAGHDVPFRARVQGHSVGLRHKEGAAHIDLVPMVPAPGARLPKRPEVALLPERDTDTWLEVLPFDHGERLHRAAADAPDLLDAICLIKAWKRRRGLSLPSIAVEHLLLDLSRIHPHMSPLIFHGIGCLAGLNTSPLPGVPSPILGAMDSQSRQDITVASQETLSALQDLRRRSKHPSMDEERLEEALCYSLLGHAPSPLSALSSVMWGESQPWEGFDR